MEQILPAFGLPKETITATTILYENTKVKVRSPDGDIDYFDFGDILALYLFIICLDYMLSNVYRLIERKQLAKERNRRYLEQENSWQRKETEDTSNKQSQTRTTVMIHSRRPNPCYIVWNGQTGGIGLHVNADKTEYMCFNQRGDISTLNGGSLKLMD